MSVFRSREKYWPVFVPDVNTLVIDARDEATEVTKLGNYKLILESLGYNLEVLFHNPVEIEKFVHFLVLISDQFTF